MITIAQFQFIIKYNLSPVKTVAVPSFLLHNIMNYLQKQSQDTII